MSTTQDFLFAIIVMGMAAFACRAGGFLMMRFVPVTPRLEAALSAIPLAVMIGIMAPVLANGHPPELVALVVIAAVMKVTRSDVVAALTGVAVVALGRALGL
ncbi:MAG: AzlD protein [Rhodospirillales bacterium]|nr:AzlD protein [Rhodospirillales bacterium]